MSIEENKELARIFRQDLWNQGDLTLADRILHPQCRIDARVPFRTDFIVGPEAVKQLVEFYLSAFSDVKMAIEHLVADELTVSARWTGTGVATGLLPGGEGRSIRTSGIDMFRIEAGRIVDGWISWDVLGLMMELGLELPAFPDWERIRSN